MGGSSTNFICSSVIPLQSIKEERFPYLCMGFQMKVKASNGAYEALFFLFKNYLQGCYIPIPIPLPVLCGVTQLGTLNLYGVCGVRAGQWGLALRALGLVPEVLTTATQMRPPSFSPGIRAT